MKFWNKLFARRTVLLIVLLAFNPIYGTSQSVDRVQQLQEIVQLINQLKVTTDPIAFSKLYDMLKEKELAFISPTATDRLPYNSFLQLPDTGIIRLMPREKFDGVLFSRGGAAYYSFARRTHLYDFGSDLSLEQDAFKVGFAGADFGFITSLGDLPIESVLAETPGIPYLMAYSPPMTEAEARAEYQRSGTGFQAGNFTYRRFAAAAVNTTYAVRAVGYGSSDCLIAFRVLRKDTDGSLILVWKRLKWFATPRLGGGFMAVTSAASYTRGLFAQESIATAFVSDLTDKTVVASTTPLPIMLGGVTVSLYENIGDEITNGSGVISAAKIFSVSPNQVNFEISDRYIAPHHGIIRVQRADGTALTELVRFENVVPALFTANADGQGVPAALILRINNGVQSYEPLARFDSAQNKFVPLPIDFGAANEQIYLVLFGTGIRWWKTHEESPTISVKIGNVDAPVLFAGEQGLNGLDQINVSLPRELAGQSDLNLALTVNGKTANAVKINIK